MGPNEFKTMRQILVKLTLICRAIIVNYAAKGCVPPALLQDFIDEFNSHFKDLKILVDKMDIKEIVADPNKQLKK